MKYVEGLVSVIMPTYKRSEKLLRAIDSVLNQTYKNLELLLVMIMSHLMNIRNC